MAKEISKRNCNAGHSVVEFSRNLSGSSNAIVENRGQNLLGLSIEGVEEGRCTDGLVVKVLPADFSTTSTGHDRTAST
jgi:hypothetical protein